MGRLKGRTWSTDEERDSLLAEVVDQTRNQEDLIELLYNGDSAVRRSAMKRLRQIITPPALDAFMKVSREQPTPSIQAIAGALAKLLPPDAHARAIPYLDHKDKAIRKTAEVFLQACPLSRALVPVATRWLESGDAVRAQKIIENVERSIQEGGEDAAGLMPLVEAALEHNGELVRQVGWRIMAARKNPSDLPRFIDAITRETYTNQKLLAESITALARRGGVDLGETILPLLGSTSAVLRTTAVNVLKRLDDPDEVIRKFVVASRSMPPIVRERTMETLGDLGNRLIEPLLVLMEDPDPDVCMLAITMASTLGDDKRMVKPLLKALHAKEWWVQATAAETLGNIGAPEAIEPLTALLKDPDTVWTAVGSLASTAASLEKAGDQRGAAAALQPLMGLMKSGQRSTGDTDDTEDVRLEIINSLRTLRSARLVDVLRKVASGDRSPRVREEAISAASTMATQLGEKLEDEEQLRAGAAQEGGKIPTHALTGLDAWLARARNERASDLHIAAGQPVMIRCNGVLRHLEDGKHLDPERCARLIRDILTDEQARTVSVAGQLNLSYTVPGAGRFRANIFYDYHGLNAVFRVIPETLPTIQSIGLPPHFADVQYWHQGLLLVCGASGSGKTTTLTALINLINETRESHIITIEDPIEFVHHSRRSLVNQRELGFHTRSYARALRGALRQDPDVIVIGEMNDPETVALAMEASETGHLVIGTLNCTRAETAIDRVIGSFSPDEQNQVRLALSESLKGIIAQDLAPGSDGTSMAAIFEVIMGTSTIASVIREGKMMMIESIMQTGQAQGMQTYDDALRGLHNIGKLASDTVLRRARNRNNFQDLIDAEGEPSAEEAPAP